MNLFKLAWKNTWAKPWQTFLVLVLMVVGLAALRVTFALQKEAEKGLSEHISGVDMVIGAKGSPLQLVLSSVFHIDDPTGNVNQNELKDILDHPLIHFSSQLAYGDGYKGYRILGHDSSFFKFYPFELDQGRLARKNMEVVLGYEVAQVTGLKIGDHFHSVHGLGLEGKAHDHKDFIVRGIFRKTGRVHDKLIFTPLASVWDVHNQALDSVKYITAALVHFKTPLGKLQLPRMINGETKMQAAIPNMEAQRVSKLTGGGIGMIRFMAILLVVLSALGMFGNLWQRFQEREGEWRLLRQLGFSKKFVFGLIQTEAFLYFILGLPLAFILSVSSLSIASNHIPKAFNVQVLQILKSDIYIVLGVFLLVVLSGMIPGIQAYRRKP